MVNESIEYNFELDDWMALNRHFISQSKQYRRYFMVMKWLLPAMFMVYIVRDLLSRQLNVAMITMAVVTSILWVIFLPKRLKKNAEDRFLKLLKAGNNNSILGQHTIQFSDEGLRITKPSSETMMKWESFVKADQTIDHYFLYNSAISAVVIPKLQLGNKSAYVHEQLKQHFPELKDLQA